MGLPNWLLNWYPKIYSHIKILTKNLFCKTFCLLFHQEIIHINNISSENGQQPMAGSKNQLIMKYYSKYLVSNIFHFNFITYIKKFTIINILG